MVPLKLQNITLFLDILNVSYLPQCILIIYEYHAKSCNHLSFLNCQFYTSMKSVLPTYSLHLAINLHVSLTIGWLIKNQRLAFCGSAFA